MMIGAGLRWSMVSAYLSGMTQQQVAEGLGLHVQTMRAYLRDACVRVRSHSVLG